MQTNSVEARTVAGSRIAPAEQPWPESVETRFRTITPLRLFRVLARDERLFTRFMDGGFLDRGHLSLRHRELAILTVCARCRSEYEWGIHVKFFADRAGFTEQEILATLQPLAVAGWQGHDALVVGLCESLQDSCDLSESVWSELRANFEELAILELLLLIGKYRQVCILTNALALAPEEGARRFPT
ncbi:MAG TPA: carboxymuconolactone decarboxylase family protein [Steroidobacteraceae bacterium]|jgi:alkylhydroperoxidase family enzyme